MVISTLFLFAFGTDSWPVLACLWAIVPAIGIAMFAGAPMPRIVPEGTATMRFADLSKKPVFYLMFLMMLCAGAAEQGMSQWASAFAESGLGVTKVIGDLAGPAAFALMMGLSRTIYGVLGHRLNLSLCIDRPARRSRYVTDMQKPRTRRGLIMVAPNGVDPLT